MVTWTAKPGPDGYPSTALLTDHYEFTGLDAALLSGVAHHRATFELFTRQLPAGRRYGVVAGMARAVDAVTRFRFGDAELTYLRERAFLRAETIEWLADYRFSGDIDGYQDGELFFAFSPILTVEATFGEGLVLETVLLAILNHDAAIAAAGARMVDAAGGRSTIDGGGRRTHEEAAVAAALAAYVAGFGATSNLEAGRRFGLPTAGTTMHAFTLAHASEEAAFRAQVEAFGPQTTFLVDTFDTTEGIRRAVDAAGPTIGAIRIDSGDLGAEARRARILLDDLGATGCQIVVSGDLDEFALADLADAPVDRYLLGTRLVTGSGAPTAELVYKLVAVADAPGVDAPQRPVAKTSPGKGHRGGRKVATRVLDAEGFAVAERVLGPDDDAEPIAPEHAERGLQVLWLRDGEPVRPFSVEAARAHHAMARGELRPADRSIDPGPPALTGHGERSASTAVALTVEAVVLTIRDGRLSVLLVERDIEPFGGSWALPGGSVRADDDLDAAARRELAEETGVSTFVGHLEQLRTYAAPDRDPRRRVVTVAHLAFTPDLPAPTVGSGATGARWWPVDDLAPPKGPDLGFHHAKILANGVERARSKLEYTTLATSFVAEPFTLGHLRLVYEAVWGVDLDAANFRRKVLSTDGFVVDTGERTSVGRGKPAVRYRRGPATALQPAMLRPGPWAAGAPRRP